MFAFKQIKTGQKRHESTKCFKFSHSENEAVQKLIQWIEENYSYMKYVHNEKDYNASIKDFHDVEFEGVGFYNIDGEFFEGNIEAEVGASFSVDNLHFELIKEN